MECFIISKDYQLWKTYFSEDSTLQAPITPGQKIVLQSDVAAATEHDTPSTGVVTEAFSLRTEKRL